MKLSTACVKIQDDLQIILEGLPKAQIKAALECVREPCRKVTELDTLPARAHSSIVESHC